LKPKLKPKEPLGLGIRILLYTVVPSPSQNYGRCSSLIFFLFLDTSWLTISFFRITRYCEHGKNCRSKETKSTFIRRSQNYGLENRSSPLIFVSFSGYIMANYLIFSNCKILRTREKLPIQRNKFELYPAVAKLWPRQQVLRSFLLLLLDTSWLTISFV
jgi:hypothetical protein